MKAQAKASAPAKVILLSERFADGEPAAVLAIDRRATVAAELRTDRKIWVRSAAMKSSCYFLSGRFQAEEAPEGLRNVKRAIERAGGEAFVTKKTSDGVRIEE